MKFLETLRGLMAKATPGPWEYNCLTILTQRGIIAQAFTPQHGGTFDCQDNVFFIAYLANQAAAIAELVEAAQDECRKEDRNLYISQIQHALAALDKEEA